MMKHLRYLQAAVLCLPLLGCEAPRSMLVVEVHSNLNVPTELTKVELQVGQGGTVRQLVPLQLQDVGAMLPWRVGLTTDDAGSAGSIEVAAVGFLGTAEVVREDAIVSFVKEESLLLKLFLARECIGNPCSGAGQTCTVGGLCRSRLRTEGDLAEFSPSTARTPPMVMVGGQPDAAVSLPMDAAMTPADAASMQSDASVSMPDAPVSTPDAMMVVDASVPVDVMMTPDMMLTPVDPVPDGLVGYWQFEEGNGALVLDSTANNNHGTLAAGVWVAGGVRGGAVALDGTNGSAVTVPASASLNAITSEITIAMWVYPVAYPNNYGVISLAGRRGPGNQAGPMYGLMLDEDRGNRVHWRGAPLTTDSGAALPLNMWSHVVGSYDGNQVRLYVDGMSEHVMQRNHDLEDAIDKVLCIGGFGSTNCNGDNFPGRIDEVRVYNRALTPIEVAQLYSYR